MQTYGEDGNWSECDCEVPPSEISGPPPKSDDVTPLVGRGCAEDSSCGAGLECITSASDDFLGAGGVGGGYCTRSCVDTADCTAVDPNSECLLAGTAGLCVRTCFSKNPAPGEGKCAGRFDLVCQSVAARGEADPTPFRQPGRCLPLCRSDADCPGRVCRVSDGLCGDMQTPGGAVGAACTVGAAAEGCAGGVCLPLEPDSDRGACVATCRFSIPRVGHSCGSPPTGPVDAVCAFPQVQAFVGNEGVGDLGFCLEVCDEVSDCNQTDGMSCVPNDAVSEAVGRDGLCLLALPESDAGVDAGPAPADAGAPVQDAGAVAESPDASTSDAEGSAP